MIEASTIDDTVLALDQLLRALDEQPVHDGRRSRPAAEGASELIDDLKRGISSLVRSLLDDPVRGSLCLGIRTLGEHLDRHGGLDAMCAALDKVDALNPKEDGRRSELLNALWGGVGSWAS